MIESRGITVRGFWVLLLEPAVNYSITSYPVRLKDEKLLDSSNSTAAETGDNKDDDPSTRTDLLPRITAVISHSTARSSFHGAYELPWRQPPSDISEPGLTEGGNFDNDPEG
jgi:hypothetical protein